MERKSYNLSRFATRLLPGALLLLATVACDDDPAAPPMDLRLTSSASANTYTSSRTGHTHTDCAMRLAIRAEGGADGDVAIFRGGSWHQGSGRQDSGPVYVSGFVETFGVDRVRSGEAIRGRFSTSNTFSGGFTFRMNLRFEMPDGAQRNFEVAFPCRE